MQKDFWASAFVLFRFLQGDSLKNAHAEDLYLIIVNKIST